MKYTALPFRTVLAVVLLALAQSAFAAARYDVSYLWHRSLPSVKSYQEAVGRVLGADLASRLRIVQRSGLYGLIYHRNGTSAGATRVAKTHTRLLRSRGLEAAAPIRATAWRFVDDPPADAAADAKPASRAPAQTPEAAAPPAAGTRQAILDLERAVERHIKKLRRQGKISGDERTAWSVYDFTTGEKLVSINEELQFQAASLIKPFFALAFFHEVQHGRLHYGPKSRRHMRRMIQRSNNPSTNWILRHVGGPAAAQRILTRNYPHIFQNTRIVEYIPAGGRTYRNKASVRDYSRFLYALWKDQIPGAKEIKRLMALPGSDRLYTGAKSVPKGTRVYNKTGSTARLCGDMGILVVRDERGMEYAYTLIGIIEKQRRAPHYGFWIRSRGNVIRSVSNLVYEGISGYHNLRSL